MNSLGGDIMSIQAGKESEGKHVLVLGVSGEGLLNSDLQLALLAWATLSVKESICEE